MPVFKIHHVTKYLYDKPVKESSNEIKIFPYPCNEQEVLQHELNISGEPEVQVYTDYWGNKAGLFNLLPPHKELSIESKLIIRTTAASQLRMNFHTTRLQLQDLVNNDLHLLETSVADHIENQSVIDEIVQPVNGDHKSVAAITEYCSEYIFKYFKYIKGITNVETTLDEILQVRAGVCQDFAHIMLQMLRTLHIPGRYVSGYICPNKNGMRGEGATHAWVEAYLPGYGWAGIDPTNNTWVTNNHIKLAVGKSFKDCSPVKGTFKGPAKQQLSVYVSVGYEDGQILEELTNVKTERGEYVDEDLLQGESFAAQQQ